MTEAAKDNRLTRTEREMAGWYIRLTADEARPEHRDAFRAWLARSPDHASAYTAFRSAMSLADAALDQDDFWDSPVPAPPPAPAEILAFRRPAEARRPVRMLAGIAAAAAVLLAVMTTAWLTRPAYTEIATAVGQTREYRMEDGSVISLNTGTQLRFAFARGRRHVVLESGEAYFEVAHDTSKPFVVSVGNRDVTAVGTAFDIAYMQERAFVSVTEGIVRMSGKRDLFGGTAEGVQVSAGASAFYAADTGVTIGKTAGADVGVWRRGLLVYRDRTVAEILGDVSRYIPGRLTFAGVDRSAGRYTLTLRLADQDTMLRRLEGQLPIDVTSSAPSLYVVTFRGTP